MIAETICYVAEKSMTTFGSSKTIPNASLSTGRELVSKLRAHKNPSNKSARPAKTRESTCAAQTNEKSVLAGNIRIS